MKIDLKTMSNERKDFPSMVDQFGGQMAKIAEVVYSRIGEMYSEEPKEPDKKRNYEIKKTMEFNKMLWVLNETLNSPDFSPSNSDEIMKQKIEEANNRYYDETMVDTQMLYGVMSSKPNDGYEVMSQIVSSFVPHVDNESSQKVLKKFISDEELANYLNDQKYFTKDENIKKFIASSYSSYEKNILNYMEQGVNFATAPATILNNLITKYEELSFPEFKLPAPNLKNAIYKGTALNLAREKFKAIYPEPMDETISAQKTTLSNVETMSDNFAKMMTAYASFRGPIELGKFFKGNVTTVNFNKPEYKILKETVKKENSYDKLKTHYTALKQTIKNSFTKSIQSFSKIQPDVALGSAILSGSVSSLKNGFLEKKDDFSSNMRKAFGFVSGKMKESLGNVRKGLMNFAGASLFLAKEKLNTLEEKGAKIKKFYNDQVVTRVFGAGLYAQNKIQQHSGKMASFVLGMAALSAFQHVHGMGGMPLSFGTIGTAHDVGIHVTPQALASLNHTGVPHTVVNPLVSQINADFTNGIQKQIQTLDNLKNIQVHIPSVSSETHHLSSNVHHVASHVHHTAQPSVEHIHVVAATEHKVDGLNIMNSSDAKQINIIQENLDKAHPHIVQKPDFIDRTGHAIGQGANDAGNFVAKTAENTGDAVWNGAKDVAKGTGHVFREIGSIFDSSDDVSQHINHTQTQTLKH